MKHRQIRPWQGCWVAIVDDAVCPLQAATREEAWTEARAAWVQLDRIYYDADRRRPASPEEIKQAQMLTELHQALAPVEYGCLDLTYLDALRREIDQALAWMK